MGCFLLYALSGSRSVSWGDAGQLVLRIGNNSLANEWSLSHVHPLHFLLGRIFSLLAPSSALPFVLSTISAAAGALCISGVYLCARELGCRSSRSLLAASSLIPAQLFWSAGSQPGVYTLAAALLTAEIYVFCRIRNGRSRGDWRLLFALNGLSLANLPLALLSLPVWVRMYWKSDSSRQAPFPTLIGFWFLGGLPFWGLLLGELLRSAEVGATLHSAFLFLHIPYDPPGQEPRWVYSAVLLGSVLLSFPNLTLIQAFRGLRVQKTPLPLISLLYLLIALFSSDLRASRLLLPLYPVLALLAALGWEQLSLSRLRQLAWVQLSLLLLQPLLYLGLATGLNQTPVMERFARHMPYRNDAEALFLPWKLQERSAAKLGRECARLKAGSVLIVQDARAWYPILWELQQAEKVDELILLRPAQMEEQLEALMDGIPSFWVPANSQTEPVDGWFRNGQLWQALPLQ